MSSRFPRPGMEIAVFVLLIGVGVLFAYRSTLGNLPLRTPPTRLSNGTEPEETAIPNGKESQGTIEHVNEADFARKVLGSKEPVLVDFYADWCGPCQLLAPVLEELARETPNAKVVKVNVDENPKLAAQYEIDSIPRLLVFRDGEIVGERSGLASKTTLKSLLTR